MEKFEINHKIRETQAIILANTRELAAQTQRSMILHANIQDGEIFISNDQGQITFVPEVWREAKD
jgi:uncharacterized protein YaeQ